MNKRVADLTIAQAKDRLERETYLFKVRLVGFLVGFAIPFIALTIVLLRNHGS